MGPATPRRKFSSEVLFGQLFLVVVEPVKVVGFLGKLGCSEETFFV